MTEQDYAARVRHCVACGWTGTYGAAAHIRFIHPDASDLVVVRQMDEDFVVRLAAPAPSEPGLDVPCRRATGYAHRYCCETHGENADQHGDFPEGAQRCQWVVRARLRGGQVAAPAPSEPCGCKGEVPCRCAHTCACWNAPSEPGLDEETLARALFDDESNIGNLGIPFLSLDACRVVAGRLAARLRGGQE